MVAISLGLTTTNYSIVIELTTTNYMCPLLLLMMNPIMTTIAAQKNTKKVFDRFITTTKHISLATIPIIFSQLTCLKLLLYYKLNAFSTESNFCVKHVRIHGLIEKTP
jgi:MFS-type transporter involved in bile tolerance (Atg22 family)